MTKTKSLKKRMARIHDLEELAASVNDSSLETAQRASARDKFQERSEEIFKDYKVTAEDYADVQWLQDHVRNIARPDVDNTISYFDAERTHLYTEAGPKKMAEGALNIVPKKTGDATHDKAVKIHEKHREYMGLARRVASGDGSALAEAIGMIESDVEKSTRGIKVDNKKIDASDATVKNLKTVAGNLAQRQRGYAVAAIRSRADAERKKFDKIYDTEAARAAYTQETLEAYVADGRDGTFTAARNFELIA